MPTTRVALIQMSCEASTAANLARAVARVREAAEAGAMLICLPELFRAQYFCQREDHALFAIAESIPGPSTAASERTSFANTGLVVIASLFERRAPGLYHNTAAILDHTSTAPDNIAGDLPQDAHPRRPPLLREVLLHPRRPRVPRLRQTSAGTHRNLGLLGPVVPRRPPASPPSRAPKPSSSPPPSAGTPPKRAEFGDRQYDAWQTIQRAHAIANGVFVCAVNRVGHEDGDRPSSASSSPTAPPPRRAQPCPPHHRRGRRPDRRLHTSARNPGLALLGRLLHRRPLRPHPRPRLPRPTKRFSTADPRPPRESKSPASIGPSSATAGSTHMAASPAASSTS